MEREGPSMLMVLLTPCCSAPTASMCSWPPATLARGAGVNLSGVADVKRGEPRGALVQPTARKPKGDKPSSPPTWCIASGSGDPRPRERALTMQLRGASNELLEVPGRAGDPVDSTLLPVHAEEGHGA